jgi:hypothetical protein
MNRVTRSSLLVLVLHVAGCRKPATATDPRGQAGLSPLSNGVAARVDPPGVPVGARGASELVGMQREWVEAARSIPGGFAGGRFDRTRGQWMLRLVDTAKAAEARAALATLMPAHAGVVGIPTTEVPRAGVEEVRWSLPELYDWMRYTGVLLSQWSDEAPTPRHSGLGVSPGANRLTLGFTSEKERRSFDAFIAQKGVACELLIIELVTIPILS